MLEVFATVTIPGGISGVLVKDEGTNVVTSATTVNFTGAGVTASDVGGVATVNVPGGISGVLVKDEGTNVVTSANTINFVGSGVTASNVGGVATITVSGGGINGITVQDEGSNVLSSANTINFVGSGVTASNVGNVATVSINGISGIAVLQDTDPVVVTDTINFFGPLVNVANAFGSADVGIGLTVQDEGSTIGTGQPRQFGTINFIGNGVTATASGNVASVTIPGTSLLVKDEGSNVVTTSTINFVGSGVIASNVGGVATVTISGTGGGGGGLPGYLRTYTGGTTTVTHNIWTWYPLPLDDDALINTISASDYPDGIVDLPSGIYFYETTAYITANGSDSIENVSTAIVENLPGSGVTGNIIANGCSIILGDWQTGTLTAMGTFTLDSATKVSVAFQQYPDSYPQARAVATSGYVTTMLKLWKTA